MSMKTGKRIVSVLLTVTMLLSLLTGCSKTETLSSASEMKNSATNWATKAKGDPMPMEEYARSIWYGFVPDELLDQDPDKTKITYGQFMDMLDVAVSLMDENRLAEWKSCYRDARESNQKIDVGNAALAIFSAAEFLGGDVYARNTQDSGEGAYIGQWTPASCWGNVQRIPAGFEDIAAGDADSGSFEGWSSHYVTSRGSVISGKPLIEYENGNTMLFGSAKMTLRKAALAALRFYESAIVITERYPTADDVAILALAAQRKQNILNSETNVTYSGTAYYVSNNGKDYNDGRSPGTPWATLDKVNQAGQSGILKPGDAVFFERGGLWRGYISCAVGVTYSAYGEGEKPRIYGSPENGASPEKWELWYDQDGVKIWKFYKDTSDVGNIVLNDGEECAYRVYAYYNGSEWVVSGDDQRPFDVAENLKQDMQFYSAFELSAAQYERYKRDQGGVVYVDGIDTTGPLYLRCDRGNPGELYQSIEFQAMPKGLRNYIGLVTPAGDNVIDNLCLRYCVVNGIAMYNEFQCIEGNDNNIIQNCEIGWMGGDQHDLNREDGTVMVCGEAIVFKTHNNVIRNNYIYQAAQGTFVGEFVSGEYIDGASMASGNIFEGNLAEHCQTGFWFWDNGFDGSDGTRTEFWNNTVVRDNMMLNMGIDSWYSNEKVVFPGKEEKWECSWALKNGSSMEFTGNMTIENNVFYLSGEELIGGIQCYDDVSRITVSGNTYVQNDNRDIIDDIRRENALTTEAVLNVISQYLGDTNATVFPQSYMPY